MTETKSSPTLEETIASIQNAEKELAQPLDVITPGIYPPNAPVIELSAVPGDEKVGANVWNYMDASRYGEVTRFRVRYESGELAPLSARYKSEADIMAQLVCHFTSCIYLHRIIMLFYVIRIKFVFKQMRWLTFFILKEV